MDKTEEDFSDKSWNCEIIGVWGELDMTETKWNAVGSGPGEVHQGSYLWKLVFLLKGIEMAHYKNRAGKYWSLGTSYVAAAVIFALRWYDFTMYMHT